MCTEISNMHFQLLFEYLKYSNQNKSICKIRQFGVGFTFPYITTFIISRPKSTSQLKVSLRSYYKIFFPMNMSLTKNTCNPHDNVQAIYTNFTNLHFAPFKIFLSTPRLIPTISKDNYLAQNNISVKRSSLLKSLLPIIINPYQKLFHPVEPNEAYV